MAGIKVFFSFLGQHKGKIFLALFSTLAFLFILFPFDDLSDWVSSQVSKLSGNSVFLQFQKLRLNLVPTPGLKMEKVFFQAINTPSLSVEQLTITPSFSGVIYKKPYGQVNVQGFLKGDLDLSLSHAPRSEAGTEREKIEIQAQKISLKDVKQLANLPIQLKGQLQLGSTTLADFTWKEQPESEVDLTISQFELPPSSVPTPMGPLTLPEFKLAQVQIKGRLSAGNFLIEKAVFGKESDELQGNVKGSLGLNLENRGGMPAPVFGSYHFDIELKVKKTFQDKASAFLIFLDSYKSPTPEGFSYRFKLSGENFYAPPTIGALR